MRWNHGVDKDRQVLMQNSVNNEFWSHCCATSSPSVRLLQWTSFVCFPELLFLGFVAISLPSISCFILPTFGLSAGANACPNHRHIWRLLLYGHGRGNSRENCPVWSGRANKIRRGRRTINANQPCPRCSYLVPVLYNRPWSCQLSCVMQCNLPKGKPCLWL